MSYIFYKFVGMQLKQVKYVLYLLYFLLFYYILRNSYKFLKYILSLASFSLKKIYQCILFMHTYIYIIQVRLFNCVKYKNKKYKYILIH